MWTPVTGGTDSLGNLPILFFSGPAGALLTVVLEFVPIENIHRQMSGTVLIMTLFGGTGTLLGPLVGAGVFIWMRDFLSKHLEYWEVFVGGASAHSDALGSTTIFRYKKSNGSVITSNLA